MTGASPFAAVRASTAVELLRRRAGESPERPAYVFLRDGDEADGPLTYAALDERARAIAAWLQAEARPGDRALLLYPAGLDFLAAFFGCLYAGVIAVPAYPPRTNRPDPRIEEIVSDCDARVALTTSTVWAGLEKRLGEWEGLRGVRWLSTDTLSAGAGAWRDPGVDPGALAFLQYTSGSTRTPKGVMVSHANVLHNLASLEPTMSHGPDSVSVTWLPHFHDMGLIWGLLQPLYSGFLCYVMPPPAFLQRPLRWLEAISRYQATHSGGPNFAYELCLARVTAEQAAALDLRSWRVAFNGAEPVRAETLHRFADRFAAAGFSPAALSPCYGLAEGTLMVSFHRDAQPVVFRADGTALERNAVAPAADGAPARELVGCGRGEGVRRLAIVDPASGAEQPEGAIGEIWASGPSIAGGYWNRPEESARTFHGALPGGNEGPFLRTGDLGFLHRGDLFVTGRLKDLIIIRGLNHYPQDIERTVEESHPALRPTAGAAFSVEAEGEEQLVVVHEIERAQRNADLDEVVAAIRRTVTESHEVEPYAVVLIRPASVLKTSSGKIQRSANRAAFLDGRLAVLHEWRRAARPAAAAVPVPEAPAANGARSEDEIASWLAARLARESGLDADELDLDQPFASFGLDSARALLLIGDLETWLGRRLSPVLLWNYPTVQALARHLGA